MSGEFTYSLMHCAVEVPVIPDPRNPSKFHAKCRICGETLELDLEGQQGAGVFNRQRSDSQPVEMFSDLPVMFSLVPCILSPKNRDPHQQFVEETYVRHLRLEILTLVSPAF